MNHIYRLVWNELNRAWVAVAEIARGRGKGNTVGRASARRLSPTGRPFDGDTRACVGRALARQPILALSLALIGTPAWALAPNVLPTGGVVSAGAASISQSANALTVQQTSARAVLDWQSFNIGAAATVNFNQPNSGSVALNRISGSASEIYGKLNSNGQVFFTNPQGMLFGPGAQVNVGGILATTLSIGNSEFMAGNYRFSNPGSGSILNAAAITAAGSAVLLGNSVTNAGQLIATTVTLAAGNTVAVDLSGDGLIRAVVEDVALHARIVNSGSIGAAQVTMTAGQAAGVLDRVVNNSGVIKATGLANVGGEILLLGYAVDNSGSIVASGSKGGGGIKLMGDMAGGSVKLSGTLDASAPVAGNGGTIETSAAHVNIADTARVTTAAAMGLSGSWLIDPVDFTIAATGGDMTGAALTTGLTSNNVTIASTSGTTGSSGDVNVNDAVSWSSHTLTLNAQNNININADLTATSSASLALLYGQGAVASGNTSNIITTNATVNLPAGTTNFTTLQGSNGVVKAYTVITSLGAAGSTTHTDLQGMNGGLALNYALGGNIDAALTSGWNSLAGFTPIGTFTGTFDGLGHTISNLTINRPTSYVGLFGQTSGLTTIRNIGLVDASVSGIDSVGGLAGLNRGSISNSYATGSVSGSNNVGGLVGYGYGSISNSYATGKVTATGNRVGGLVGRLHGTISDSYAKGDVSSTGIDVGGLVGRQDCCSIRNSFATGSVSGSDTVGGLVGLAGYGSISNSYAAGDVIGTGDMIGGLVGFQVGGSIRDSFATGEVNGKTNVGGLVGYKTGSITSSFAAGKVTSTDDLGYGLVGWNSGGTITSSVWDKTTSGKDVGIGGGGSQTGATGMITADMKDVLNFTTSTTANGNANPGWDFSVTPVWKFVSGLNSEYPCLVGLTCMPSRTPLYLRLVTGGTSIYGDSPSMSYLLYDASSGGNVISDARQSGTVTWSTPLSATSAANTYGETYSSGIKLGNTAYTLSAGGSINWVIAPRPLNLTASKTYDGSTSFNSGFVLAGMANGDSQPLLTGSGSVSSANVATYNSFSSSTLALDNPNYTLSGGSVAAAITQLGSVTWVGGATGNWSLAANWAPTNNLSATGAIPNYANVAAVTIPSGATVTYDSGVSGTTTLTSLSSSGTLVMAGGTLAMTGTFATAGYQQTGGTWNQVSSSLPGFSATDFKVSGGTFIRATGGDGTTGSPYQLADIYGVQGMGSSTDTLGKSYALANNIDASGTSGWNASAGFKPIGNSTTKFTGTFDGLGHTISNLATDDSAAGIDRAVGLFAVTSSTSLIRNLGLINPTVLGFDHSVGGLVGDNSGVVSHTFVEGATGSITAGSTVGGLVGINQGTIEDSYSAIKVTGSNRVGGLVGTNTSIIVRSYSNSSVYANTGQNLIGGLVGQNDGGTISTSYATGNVASLNSAVGGLVGGNSGTVTNSYATGLVSGVDYVGGLVGYNAGTITSSYATGSVTGSTDVGGLVGSNNSGSIINSYATGSLSAIGADDSNSNVGTSSADFGASVTWSGPASGGLWTDSANWTDETNTHRLPGVFDTAVLGSNSINIPGNVMVRGVSTATSNTLNFTGSTVSSLAIGQTTAVTLGAGTGDVTINYNSSGKLNLPSAPTLILNGTTYTVITSLGAAGSTTHTDLQGMNGGLALNYALGGNIDATATSGWNLSGGVYAGFAPIGTFTGTFDGLGHTISGLTINRPTTSYVGLFGYASGGSIRNVGLVGGSVIGLSDVGGLVGYNTGSISNSYATGEVRGVSDPADVEVGGLVGYNTGSISNSYATGHVVGARNSVGGLVGRNDGGSISNSYATGSVVGGWYSTGGLVGYNSAGSISNSYATGGVSGGLDSSGGLAGDNNGDISNSYATGSVSATRNFAGGLVGSNNSGSISNSYATGAASSPNSPGGLVGRLNGSISDSFYDSTVNPLPMTGAFGSANSTGTVLGMSTADLKLRTTFPSWDFTTAGHQVWNISPGVNGGYPFLCGITGGCEAQGPTLLYLRLITGSSTYGNAPTLDYALYNAKSGGSLISDATPTGTLLWSAPLSATSAAATYHESLSGITLLNSAYALSAGPIDWVIAPRPLTVTGITGTNRTYNGTTVDALSGTAVLSGLVDGQALTVGNATSGTLGSANAGSQSVSTAITLANGTGGLASNYVLAQPSLANVTIAQAPINLSGTRTYNGTANVAASIFTLSGWVNNERLTLAGVGTVVDKNVGTNESVTLGSLALVSGTGLAGNYTFTGGTQTAAITQLASVAYTGTSGNWSTASNWAGSALPDGLNVAAVTIPSGVTVTYDSSAATTLNSLTSSGILALASGTLVLNGTGSLAALNMTGGTLTGSGSVSVTSSFSQNSGSITKTGGLTINQASGDLSVGSIMAGTLSLTSAGKITQQSNTALTASSLTLAAQSGITLARSNQVSTLAASNGGSGSSRGGGGGSSSNIAITNMIPMTITSLGNPVGSITVDNTGALTTSGVVTTTGAGSSGSVTLTAHSPLTVGAAITAAGALTLTAGSANSPSTADLLTINATIQASDVTLSANAVGGSNVPLVGVTNNTVAATQAAADSKAAADAAAAADSKTAADAAAKTASDAAAAKAASDDAAKAASDAAAKATSDAAAKAASDAAAKAASDAAAKAASDAAAKTASDDAAKAASDAAAKAASDAAAKSASDAAAKAASDAAAKAASDAAAKAASDKAATDAAAKAASDAAAAAAQVAAQAAAQSAAQAAAKAAADSAAQAAAASAAQATADAAAAAAKAASAQNVAPVIPTAAANIAPTPAQSPTTTTTPTVSTAAAPASTSEAPATGSGSSSSGSSAPAATAPAATTASSSTSDSSEKPKEKPAPKAVIQTVTIGTTTVQKPADQVVTVSTPKGQMLVCR